jgi:hypothetical protein
MESGVVRAMQALETAIAANNKAARKAIGRFIDLLPFIRTSGVRLKSGQGSGDRL